MDGASIETEAAREMLQHQLHKEAGMPKNMGTVDRVVRVLLALVVAALYAAHQISGVVAIVLGVLAAVFLLTSLVSFCPLYMPFKLSTRKKS
jgi:hypothetical protein